MPSINGKKYVKIINMVLSSIIYKNAFLNKIYNIWHLIYNRGFFHLQNYTVKNYVFKFGNVISHTN